MRQGFIFLHRQAITPDEWRNPGRVLAWIDLLTMADYKTGIVECSFGSLSRRWRVSKHTAHRWIHDFMATGRLKVYAERKTERSPERYFIVNYAKYQHPTERKAERKAERLPYKEVKRRNLTEQGGKILDWLKKSDIENPEAYLAKIERGCGAVAIRKAWRDATHGSGVESPGAFFARCKHYQEAIDKKEKKDS